MSALGPTATMHAVDGDGPVVKDGPRVPVTIVASLMMVCIATAISLSAHIPAR
jgi:hypothetical protein